MELAEQLGMPLEEKQFTPGDLYGADGAFFTGTAVEVAGIQSLDGHDFALPWEETMGYELLRAYKRLVSKNELKDFALV